MESQESIDVAQVVAAAVAILDKDPDTAVAQAAEVANPASSAAGVVRAAARQIQYRADPESIPTQTHTAAQLLREEMLADCDKSDANRVAWSSTMGFVIANMIVDGHTEVLTFTSRRIAAALDQMGHPGMLDPLRQAKRLVDAGVEALRQRETWNGGKGAGQRPQQSKGSTAGRAASEVAPPGTDIPAGRAYAVQASGVGVQLLPGH